MGVPSSKSTMLPVCLTVGAMSVPESAPGGLVVAPSLEPLHAARRAKEATVIHEENEAIRTSQEARRGASDGRGMVYRN
jgi:hypothetical protein